MDDWNVLLGWWTKQNEFVDRDGVAHFVCPFSNTLSEVENRFPVYCFMLLQKQIIKTIVEVDESEKF